jgi:diguanylate cyclase (GGDEF)-like protein
MEGPISGPARGDPYYSARLKQLARLDVEEADAEHLWRAMTRHRRELVRLLGRDVGQQVALLDYVINIRPRLEQPQIIEKTALEAIEQLAVEDALTGLFNRRHFESELTRESERCRRYGGWLSLLVLDLDHFKAINDERGHRAGDRVLQAVGSVVLHHVRTPDIPCRCGGDEFAVILPDTPESDALAVAERIRSAIESSLGNGSGFATGPSPDGDATRGLMVTASAGVASLNAGASSPERLFMDADGALYRAKREGGNRVVVAPSTEGGRFREAPEVGVKPAGRRV